MSWSRKSSSPKHQNLFTTMELIVVLMNFWIK